MATSTISVTEFKAKCLDLLDQIANRQIESLAITKHGKVIALLVPPSREQAAQQLHGFMRGSVVIPDGFDLTQPVL